MQHYFHAYPVSPCFSTDSPLAVMNKDGSFHVIDDTQSFARLTSNDSGISFDTSDNESFFSDEYDAETEHTYALLPIEQQQQEEPTPTITEDAQQASTIRDEEKKFFCENTAWAWHGEFARLIMATALTYDIDYRLMLFDARLYCPRAYYAYYSMRPDYNAKAQFKCDQCGHCWTSMRARCSFYISRPDQGGIVLLRLFAQQCQHCYATVDPLWYFDEICRVMKDLAWTMHKHFFPRSLESIRWDITHDGTRPVRRLFQRKGQMRAQHNPDLCEACQLGLCYP